MVEYSCNQYCLRLLEMQIPGEWEGRQYIDPCPDQVLRLNNSRISKTFASVYSLIFGLFMSILRCNGEWFLLCFSAPKAQSRLLNVVGRLVENR